MTAPECKLYMNNYSKVKAISEAFHIPDDQKDIDSDASKLLPNLIDINSLAVNQHIAVSGKVTDIHDSITS